MAVNLLIPAIEWGTAVIVTGEITHGSYIIDNISDTSDVEVGMRIDDDNFEFPTVVESKTGSSITLNKPSLNGGPSRSNLFQFPRDLNNSYWAKTRSRIVQNAIEDHLGFLTMDKLIEDTTASNSHVITKSIAWNLGPQTISFVLKAAERSVFRLGYPTAQFGAVSTSGYFDLVTESFRNNTNCTGTITNLGNGYFYCTITATCTVAASGSITMYLSTGGTTTTYTGDGFSGLYITRMQLEEASSASAFIDDVKTFTSRLGRAYYWDNDGKLVIAAYNAPRYSYNPDRLDLDPVLLVEAAATNLCLYSEDLSQANWVKGVGVTATVSTIEDPRGGSSAFRINITGTDNGIYQLMTVVASSYYCFSYFAKLDTLSANDLRISFYDATAGAFIHTEVLPQFGTPNSTGWTRLSYTVLTPVGCVSMRAYITRRAAVSSGAFYASLFQLELMPSGFFGPTTYWETGAASATRPADTVSSAPGTRTSTLTTASLYNYFDFEFPPSKDTDNQIDPSDKVTTALSGIRQVQVDYLEEKRDLTFGFLTSDEHLELRESFYVPWAVYGNEFKYYPDKEDNNYETYELSDLKFSPKRQVKKHPSFLYELAIKMRRVL